MTHDTDQGDRNDVAVLDVLRRVLEDVGSETTRSAPLGRARAQAARRPPAPAAA